MGFNSGFKGLNRDSQQDFKGWGPDFQNVLCFQQQLLWAPFVLCCVLNRRPSSKFTHDFLTNYQMPRIWAIPDSVSVSVITKYSTSFLLC